MKKLIPYLLLLAIIPFISKAETHKKAYDEFDFVKTFASKSTEFVLDKLGKPDSESSRTPKGGRKYELFVYHHLVFEHKKPKNLYYETQVGIVNNRVETIGNTNRPTE